MMGSDLPCDEEDDHYPEGKLPLLTTAEDPSSDSEEIVFSKSDIKPSESINDDPEPEDEMVTVNLSDDEPGESSTLDFVPRPWAN